MVFRACVNRNFTGKSPDTGSDKNNSVQYDKNKGKRYLLDDFT